MTRHLKLLLTCLTAAHLAACAMTVGDDEGSDDPGPPELDDPIAVQCVGDGCQMQGRTLLSKELDVGGYLSFPLKGKRLPASGDVTITISVTGELSAGTQSVKGLSFTASNGAVVKIDEISTPADEPSPQYTLSYTARPGAAPINPCVHLTAIAIDGDFDAGGHHAENTVGNRFSFACKDEGVAYKCVNFDFPPGSDPTLEQWKAHQVCTRALRADYCKNGKSFTLDETFIRIWDDYDPPLGYDEPPWVFQGLRNWPPPEDVYKFESVWPEDDKKPPVCLSRARWHALEPDALDGCKIKPEDPRTNTMVKFCDQVHDLADLPGLTGHSIVLESKYTDVSIEAWSRGAPYAADRVATITGYYPGPDGVIPTLRPFEREPGYQPVETLGTLLRSLPGSIGEDEVTDVFSYYDATLDDRVLAGPTSSSWPPAGSYNAMTWEGMVFDVAPDFPPTAPLYLYQEDGGGEFYNGLTKDDPNDDEVDLIGYILVPEE